MVNYLALLGWSPPDGREKFDRRYLVEHFDLDRVIRSPAKFDRDKLLHFNNDAINAMEPQEFTARLREHARRYHPEFPATLGEDRFALFAGCNRARSRTLEDPFRDRFFVMGDDQIVYEPSRALHKALCGGTPSGYAHLEALLPVLRALAPWTVKALEEAITRYAAGAAGGQLGRVAQPLRVAVSGGVVSPAIFETLAILGRDPVLRRIERCLALRPASEPATEAQAGRRGRQEMSGRGAPE
jgi:glutamyl-tRNA synthetase